jgi:predicted metal-dependent hydrolase
LCERTVTIQGQRFRHPCRNDGVLDQNENCWFKEICDGLAVPIRYNPQNLNQAITANMPKLKYLAHYPEALQAQARQLLQQNRLATMLNAKYPNRHEIRTDKALYDYVLELKCRYMRSTEPLSKIVYDNTLHVIKNALGTHSTVSRVQGGKLKSKREIRVASLFKTAPPEFLKMIVVHELAHLKEREHDKAFYQLCAHMEPDYHQLEFDLRLYLTQKENVPNIDEKKG